MRILSVPERKSFHAYVSACEDRLQELNIEHELISKYHSQYWFQQARQQSEKQLLERYYYLTSIIEILEEEINETKTELKESINPWTLVRLN